MTTQLELLTNQVPDHVMEAIAWAKYDGSELVLMVNGNTTGAGQWLRENLEIRAIAPMGEQVAVKARAPQWTGELRGKRWQGASGSNHPANYINW